MAEGPLHWLVTSEQHPEDTYAVELDWRAGNGHCTCDHFLFRIRPALKAGKLPPTGGETRCKHIKAARETFAQTMITRLARWQ